MSAALAMPTPWVGNRDEPIGLLAAWGRFPLAFAEKAREVGLKVSCVGLKGLADPALQRLVWRFHWTWPIQLGGMINHFKKDGVRRLVMCGKVNKSALLHSRKWLVILRMWPDWRALRAFYAGTRRDNRDDSILLEVVREMARDGLTLSSALELCPELLVSQGFLTRRRLRASEMEDIKFGWELAKAMGNLDVGQSVAVKDRAVLAVEAVEGTDQAILRAGGLCRAGNFVVVKVAKPNQDMRFDVPTAGCTTIETMHRAGASVLAIEAGKTILLDQVETIRLADRLGIAIVALTG